MRRSEVSLGIDFVPNMYKVMAVKPDFLEAKLAESEGCNGKARET